MSIRQAKIQGEVIVAKPVLMLALIEGIESGVFTNNRFVLNEWLEAHYLKLMLEYTRHSKFAKPSDISNPFWHLSTDGFWHLQLRTKEEITTTPSKAWLKENVTYAYFDDDLWILLQNKEWRTRLRDFIVEHKLIVGR
jgi:putative restriction endonuclease